MKYAVYYWHNDGGIVITHNGLTYDQAVKQCQNDYTDGLQTYYTPSNDQIIKERNYKRC